MNLSQRRADSIKRYLAEKGGFSPDRIDAIGYGSTEPLKEEITVEDRAINRRVEFKVIKPDSEKKPVLNPETDEW